MVVAVLTAAIVLPALDGIGVAGTAAPIPLPADPRRGDCLLTAFPGVEPPAGVTARNPSADGRGVATPPAGRSPSPIVFGGCDERAIAGEVLAVLSVSGADYATRIARVRATGPDCQVLAFAYAGLQRTDGNNYGLRQPPDGPVTWNLAVNLRAAWIFPDLRTRAAGRTWAACVAGPASGGSYQGSLMGAFEGGELPNGFGSCWDQLRMDVAMRSVNCGDPHQSEIISTGTVAADSTVTRAEIEGSCRQLASRVMGRPDPTAGGVLGIEVDPQYDAPPHRRFDVICYIVPTANLLTGTLVGLAGRPVPLTH